MILKEKDTSLSLTNVKELNMNKLFCYVYQNGPVSKLELASALNLSIPTINKYLHNFEKNGLISQNGSFQSTGGRKAAAYHINSDHGYAVGVYITQGFYIISIINLSGKQVFSRKYQLCFEPNKKYGNEIRKAVNQAIHDVKIEDNILYGIGLSVPGIVKNLDQDAVVQFSPSLLYDNWKLSDLGNFQKLGKYQNITYLIENDANLGGFYEAWGSNESFAYLHIAGGVGGAIIINGNQYHGYSNVTAEFGHMIITPEGRLCNCGRRGCLETYISRDALSHDINISLEDFFRLLKSEDNYYQEIFNKYLDFLCMGISNIRLALGLDVVIAGEITEYLIPYEKAMLERLQKLDRFETKKYFRFSKNKKENASSQAAALKIVSNFISNI